MPPELTTFLLSALPLTELRLALPWGIVAGGLSDFSAYFWSVAGSVIAMILTVLLLEPVANFFRRLAFFDRILTRIFAHTRTKHSKNFTRFGAIFLVLFVAVPLPGSGGYSGALVAYLFGVSPRIAIFLNTLGLVISGLIVLALTNGFFEVSKFF